MARSVGGSFLLSLVALALGCGGLSTEESQQRCDQLRARDACVTQAAYDQCVSCYEECGDSCEPSASCPQTFVCID